MALNDFSMMGQKMGIEAQIMARSISRHESMMRVGDHQV
jgi:hypothetical protein